MVVRVDAMVVRVALFSRRVCIVSVRMAAVAVPVPVVVEEEQADDVRNEARSTHTEDDLGM
jgi:hypothetical protein